MADRPLNLFQHAFANGLVVFARIYLVPLEVHRLLRRAVRLLEIDQEAKRLASGNAPFAEKFVLYLVDIRVGDLRRAKTLEHLLFPAFLLFVRFNIAPVLEADVVVKDDDIVRLRQPVENPRLKRRKRRKPEDVDRAANGAWPSLAHLFEKLAQGEFVPRRGEHPFLAKEFPGKCRLGNRRGILDVGSQSFIKPGPNNLFAVDFILVHQVGKLHGKLPRHPRLAARIDLERPGISFGNVAAERCQLFIIVLQQNRHYGVRVCVVREKLRTLLPSGAFAQQTEQPLFDERELQPHAKLRRIREHLYLQPFGDVGVRHHHLRELERIGIRPAALLEQPFFQVLRQILDPATIKDLQRHDSSTPLLSRTATLRELSLLQAAQYYSKYLDVCFYWALLKFQASPAFQLLSTAPGSL